MTETLSRPSQRDILRRVYNGIIDVAKPGDILIFISDTGKHFNKTIPSRLYRNWKGLEKCDTSITHLSVYVGSKKETKGSMHRPYIVHADRGGTTENYVAPEYFRNKPLRGGQSLHCRVEVVQYPDLEAADREKIVAYVRSMVGKPFDHDMGWRHDLITYALGIRTKAIDANKVSCHGLAFTAYGLAGIYFPHQLRSAPNLLGRLFGHPLGHPLDYVNPLYNYLRDHHLYKDPRFIAMLAVAGNGFTIQDSQITYRPGKYSWNPYLRTIYSIDTP